jgi:hypothetical protein
MYTAFGEDCEVQYERVRKKAEEYGFVVAPSEKIVGKNSMVAVREAITR